MTNRTRNFGLDCFRVAAIITIVLVNYFGKPKEFFSFVTFLAHCRYAPDIFFVLSGFLISTQWFRYTNMGLVKNNFKIFFIKRALRILPCYYLTLVAYILYNRSSIQVEYSLKYYFIFLQNYFSPEFFTHTWSLCCEVMFYLTFPVISLLINPKSKKAGWSFFLLILISPVFRLQGVLNIDPSFFSPKYSGFIDKIFYFQTHMRLEGFGIGTFLGYLSIYKPSLWKFLERNQKKLLGLALVLFLYNTLGLIEGRYLRHNVILGPLIFSLVFGMVLPWLYQTNWAPSKVVTFLAKISYPIYLIHYLVKLFNDQLFRNLEDSGLNSVIEFTSYWVFLLLMSYLIHKVVERPSLKLREILIKQLKSSEGIFPKARS